MGLIPAKCTSCGANIQVNETKEAGICEACGTAFITEKAINNYVTNINNITNNNFAGANVTIQNEDNIEGLLQLARRELQSKYYSSKNLHKYLDDIVIKSPEGTERIKALFVEFGLYEIANTVINGDKYLDEGLSVANLLTKYDSENLISCVKWGRTFFVIFLIQTLTPLI